MKKLLSILLAGILLLIGCSFQKQDAAVPQNTVVSEDAAVPEENTAEKITEDVPEESKETKTADAEQAEESSVLASLPESFFFASGAGAWSTDIHIEPDGTFSGEYHDSDMGDAGDNYPNGTIYLCNFSGKFSMPVQIDEYTYSMKLESLEVEETPGVECYEDDIRYIYSEPYGLEDADEIILYLPGSKVADLPEEFLSWTELAYSDEVPETLPFYGLYNVKGGEGFVGYTQ